MWALGVTLFVVGCTRYPFNDKYWNSDFGYGKDPNYRNLKEQKADLFWAYYDGLDATNEFSDELKHLISGILRPNPETRFTLDDIFAHPWFQGETATQEEVAEELEARANPPQPVPQ